MQRFIGLLWVLVLTCLIACTGGGGSLSGASAKCRDGSYSFSKNCSGTCSSHGGVAEWYNGCGSTTSTGSTSGSSSSGGTGSTTGGTTGGDMPYPRSTVVGTYSGRAIFTYFDTPWAEPKSDLDINFSVDTNGTVAGSVTEVGGKTAMSLSGTCLYYPAMNEMLVKFKFNYSASGRECQVNYQPGLSDSLISPNGVSMHFMANFETASSKTILTKTQ